jgi:predicted GH43/DUF377 family glycosyl hydrolase
MIAQEDLAFPCLDIMNAGAVKHDGHYVLLVRVEDMRGRSVFVPARSQDGLHFTLCAHSAMSPAQDGPFAQFESRGVEDPRITELDGVFYVVYTAYSSYGTRLSLAKTEDFEEIERIALISEPDNKNGALFPEKINDRYARLERPRDGGNIWISYSDDLIYWGSSVPVMAPRGGGFWDSNRVGCAAPPIRIDDGWLMTYYGVKSTSAGPIFRLGAAVLDAEDPCKVLKRTSVPLLTPREPYERIGDVGNVVFCCGAILEDDGELKVYYGAANEAICLGSAQLGEILENCLPGGGV